MTRERDELLGRNNQQSQQLHQLRQASKQSVGCANTNTISHNSGKLMTEVQTEREELITERNAIAEVDFVE